jgi:excisionase family DNA binding protein
VSDELITIGQAAAVLGVQRSQVDRWIKAGRLDPVTLPSRHGRTGRWRYLHRSQVEAFRRERELTRGPREKG